MRGGDGKQEEEEEEGETGGATIDSVHSHIWRGGAMVAGGNQAESRLPGLCVCVRAQLNEQLVYLDRLQESSPACKKSVCFKICARLTERSLVMLVGACSDVVLSGERVMDGLLGERGLRNSVFCCFSEKLDRWFVLLNSLESSVTKTCVFELDVTSIRNLLRLGSHCPAASIQSAG